MESWVIFFICCVGLWVPGWPLFALRKDQKFRRLKPEGPWSLVLSNAPNWIDFIRAGAFSFVLSRWFQDFIEVSPKEDGKLALGALLGCMAVGTLVQCLFSNKTGVLPANILLGRLDVALSEAIPSGSGSSKGD